MVTFRERLSHAWHWPESRDLTAPLDRWRRRHIWPLLVYGGTFGMLYQVPGAHALNSWELSPNWLVATGKMALLALPISLAVDLAIICLWYLALRVDTLSGRRVSCRLRIVRHRPAAWRWRHEWFFTIWLALTVPCILAIPLWSRPAGPGDEFSWPKGIIVSACMALFAAPIAALPLCFFGWLFQGLCYLRAVRRSDHSDPGLRPRDDT